MEEETLSLKHFIYNLTTSIFFKISTRSKKVESHLFFARIRNHVYSTAHVALGKTHRWHTLVRARRKNGVVVRRLRLGEWADPLHGVLSTFKAPLSVVPQWWLLRPGRMPHAPAGTEAQSHALPRRRQRVRREARARPRGRFIVRDASRR